MTTSLSVGGFLPDATLADAGSGSTVPLRSQNRDSVVLVHSHGPECAACGRYLADLAGHVAELAAWDGHVVALIPDKDGAAAKFRERALPFPTLIEDERTKGLMDDAGVVVADRYGQVYAVAPAGPAHAFLAPQEVEQWVRFLAIQCPECGVHDDPGPAHWGE